MSLFIVRVILTNTGMHIPEFERYVGPFRSEEAADEVRQRLRRRYVKHLKSALVDADDEMEVVVETFRLDGRTSLHQYRDLESVVRDRYIGYDGR